MPALSMVVAPTQKRAEDMADSTYESSLSTLARNVLQDKSPRLFEYEIGFQLLEKSDDGDKAVGVFGFQVGPETLYAPVIFNNGAVKGTELLWAKSLGQFIPLAEGWVNAYMRRRPTNMGAPISKEQSRTGVGYPDLIPLIRSPFKMAHLDNYPPPPREARLHPREAKVAMAAMKAAAARAFTDLDNLDLRKVAARSPRFAQTLTHWLDEYPGYKRAYMQFYPGAQPPAPPMPPALGMAPPSPVLRPGPMPAAPAPIGSSLAQAMAPTVGGVGGLGTQGATPKSSPVLGGGGLGGPAAGSLKDNAASAMAKTAGYGTVSVVTEVQAVGKLIPLSLKQKSDIAANNYSVSDDRDEASMVVPVSHNLHLSNPKQSGRYKVLRPDGEFADRLVVFLRDRRADRRVLVLDVSDSGSVKAYGRCEPGDVWVNERDEDQDTPTGHYKSLASAISNFPEPKAKTPNRRSEYLVIGPDGVGFGPFKVKADLTEEGSPTTLSVDECYCSEIGSVGGHDDNDMLWYKDKANPYWGYGTRYDRTPSQRAGHHHDATLVLTGKPGHTILRDRGDLLVPSGAKMLTLEEGDAGDEIDNVDDSKDKLTLGRPEDLNNLIGRKSAELVVDKQYGRYLIGKKAGLTEPAAVKELVEGWDLRLDDALDLLKQADRAKTTARVVPSERVMKLASLYQRSTPKTAFQWPWASKPQVPGGYGAPTDAELARYMREKGITSLPKMTVYHDPDTGKYWHPDRPDAMHDSPDALFADPHSTFSDGSTLPPVKRAFGGPPDSYNVGSDVGAPDFPEMPRDYTEQTLSGAVPANTPQDFNLPIDPSMLDQNRSKMMNDFYAPPENSTINQAAQAAQKGVKEVFDTGSFSTLMKRHGDDVLIDDNLPDLMKALGAVGTLLFNLYYNDEEFADRYGKNDLVELEGVLRSAFKSVGESLLYLKQKSVRAFPGDYGVDFSGSAPNN